WLAMFACFTAFLSAVRLPQQYSIVIVGSTFATLAKALPLMTIGGFGVHEAGWALGFSLTGMETGLAITSGFAVNILILLTSSCLGGAALLWINRAKWPLLGREPAMAQSGFHAADRMEMSPLSEHDTFSGRDHDRRVSDSDDK
ncbi:MAG: hypothetical protein KDD78_15220, partial [Caldilineaceae bacterium]|nr:hypothetical protein [Caldilineaceae bacterium]